MWVDAETLLRPALVAIQEEQRDEWIAFSIRFFIGEALMGRKKNADGEPLLLHGYEGLTRRQADIPTRDGYWTTEAIERLARLYESLGKPDEEAKWRKELEKTRKEKLP